MIALYICVSLLVVRRVAGGCQLVPPTNTHSEQIGHTSRENIYRKYLDTGLNMMFRPGVCPRRDHPRREVPAADGGGAGAVPGGALGGRHHRLEQRQVGRG